MRPFILKFIAHLEISRPSGLAIIFYYTSIHNSQLTYPANGERVLMELLPPRPSLDGDGSRSGRRVLMLKRESRLVALYYPTLRRPVAAGIAVGAEFVQRSASSLHHPGRLPNRLGTQTTDAEDESSDHLEDGP